MIEFTQFLRPHGEPRIVYTSDREEDVEEKAAKIKAAGFRFEVEQLTTGDVHMTITSAEADHASELCANAPGVPDTHVDKMIREFNIEAAIEELEAMKDVPDIDDPSAQGQLHPEGR